MASRSSPGGARRSTDAGPAGGRSRCSSDLYVCATCGLVTDRDENAALNLARYGEQVIAGSGPEINGRGAGRKTTPVAQVAVKRQPGTAHAGKTGTVPPQDGTAA